MQSTILRKIISPSVMGFLLAGSLAFAPRQASAAYEFYVVFVETSQGQIKGTSTFAGHEGWIKVDSASLGNLLFTERNHNAIVSATSRAEAGKVNRITIQKTVDSASPKLLRAASRGEAVRQVVVECCSGDHVKHRLTITGGTVSVKPDGPGKEEIIFVGGKVSYN